VVKILLVASATVENQYHSDSTVADATKIVNDFIYRALKDTAKFSRRASGELGLELHNFNGAIFSNIPCKLIPLDTFSGCTKSTSF
jgi:hypothetical protein